MLGLIIAVIALSLTASSTQAAQIGICNKGFGYDSAGNLLCLGDTLGNTRAANEVSSSRDFKASLTFFLTGSLPRSTARFLSNTTESGTIHALTPAVPTRTATGARLTRSIKTRRWAVLSAAPFWPESKPEVPTRAACNQQVESLHTSLLTCKRSRRSSTLTTTWDPT